MLIICFLIYVLVTTMCSVCANQSSSILQFGYPLYVCNTEQLHYWWFKSFISFGIPVFCHLTLQFSPTLTLGSNMWFDIPKRMNRRQECASSWPDSPEVLCVSWTSVLLLLKLGRYVGTGSGILGWEPCGMELPQQKFPIYTRPRAKLLGAPPMNEWAQARSAKPSLDQLIPTWLTDA